jgi:hypothetical protein
LESLKSELEASAEEKKKSYKTIASLQHNLDLLTKDQEALHNSLTQIEEVKRENISLKVFSTHYISMYFMSLFQVRDLSNFNTTTPNLTNA